jgi:hypothetical protein
VRQNGAAARLLVRGFRVGVRRTKSVGEEPAETRDALDAFERDLPARETTEEPDA